MERERKKKKTNKKLKNRGVGIEGGGKRRRIDQELDNGKRRRGNGGSSHLQSYL